MRVAVYAINKNHAENLQRWADCARDADYLIMADTGSTDDSIAAGLAAGIQMSSIVIDPWRYDHARNAALALVPDDVDYCIALDTDEFLQPGWRRHLQEAFDAGITRPRYRFVWSWDERGKPGLEFAAEKIHPRHGYRWRHAAHETLFTEVQERQGWCGLEIHHHQVPKPYRAHELPLLEIAVTEAPDDDRMAHYYARALMFAGRGMDALRQFQRHLDLPSARWADERAQSMRYMFRITKDVRYLHDAYREAPHRREAAVDAARYHHELGEWDECLLWAKRALDVKDRDLLYLTEPDAWGSLPHDLAAVAAYNLGFFREADWHGMEALKLDPYDQRLVRNVGFYREKVAA